MLPLRTKVRSVSRMVCMLKKLRQDHPYTISRKQDACDDELQADGAIRIMDSSELMCHLDQRTIELERLLHKGEEILQKSNTNLPCIGTPASAASIVFEDSIESPSKRSRNEKDCSFISLSSSIDELCQQVSILSKECKFRHSEGFGTPHHSRTPERLQILALTTAVLDTIHEKVKILANAHKTAEAHMCKELNFDACNDDETSTSVASLSAKSSKALHFHLDDEALSEPSFSAKSFRLTPPAKISWNDEVSALPAWADFDVDDLPGDGFKAFPLAHSPVTPKWEEVTNQCFPQDSPIPSQVLTVNSNDPGKLMNQLVPQVDPIQRDVVSRRHEVEEAGIERMQMTSYESLTKSHSVRNIQNLENDINSTQRCQQAAATRMAKMLPIETRCLICALTI